MTDTSQLTWRRSTHSGGNGGACVESRRFPTGWRSATARTPPVRCSGSAGPSGVPSSTACADRPASGELMGDKEFPERR